MRKTTTRTTLKAPAPVKVVEIHPAEQAGIAVHQAIENGVGTVADAVTSGVGYVFGFVKGLVKGQ